MNPPPCFTRFKNPIKNIALPEVFDFPFYYEPHPISVLAAKELQEQIQHNINWEYDFGLNPDSPLEATGKMFGVLVVETANGELGYLSAYSGQIDTANLHPTFVPALGYQPGGKDDPYALGQIKLSALTEKINKLESSSAFELAKKKLEEKKNYLNQDYLNERARIKARSKKRKAIRQEYEAILIEEDFDRIHKIHVQKRINDDFYLKSYKEYVESQIKKYQSEFNILKSEIDQLKEERKNISNQLQEWLFAQYNFLNSRGETKNVVQLFKKRIPNIPPSGAGDCAAPKLVQYAYQHKLKPVAMAEFWWGAPPESNVRKHKNYYPACRGKCEPILNFMLQGIDVAPNPLLENPAIGKSLETIYEDEHLVVIVKPPGFLSVPGKFVTDSVQERMAERYPDATGPMIVHRLDMSTSGLMVVTKTKEAHQLLQGDFKRRNVTKRYVALLDGVLNEDEGFIDLPLRVDHDNRPFQIVCHEFGKPSRTKFEVIERLGNTTKVYFYPYSGRTHQLRVHAAHQKGLGIPIVGDDLYGNRKDFLHLHAEMISFKHPITKEVVEFSAEAKF